MSRKLGLIVGGGLVYAAGVAGAIILFGKGKQYPPLTTEQRREVYDKTSKDYDKEVGSHEKLAGIETMRKRLIHDHVKGPYVLEVAAGTGPNLDFYKSRPLPAVQGAGAPLLQLDLVDNSAGMLSVALKKALQLELPIAPVEPALASTLSAAEQTKLSQLVPSPAGAAPAASAAGQPIFTFKLQDASQLSPPVAALSGASVAGYDTVLDCFGLCSFESPIAVLHAMVRATRPGGRILLLEHGQSTAGLVNRVLHKYSSAHEQQWGCQWDKDILQLVQEAAASTPQAVPGKRMVLEKQERRHLGTTYLVVLRVEGEGEGQQADSAAQAAAGASKPVPVVSAPVSSLKGALQ